jgi:hypothetical protein
MFTEPFHARQSTTLGRQPCGDMFKIRRIDGLQAYFARSGDGGNVSVKVTLGHRWKSILESKAKTLVNAAACGS